MKDLIPSIQFPFTDEEKVTFWRLHSKNSVKRVQVINAGHLFLYSRYPKV